MKIFFVSLGCDKTKVDAERILGRLIASGHELTDEEEQAEAVIVNTCCFIDEAKEESISEILSYAKLKNTGRLKALVVTGCMAERYREDIIREMPEVDAVVSLSANDRIAEILDKAADKSSESRLYASDKTELFDITGRRVLTTGTGYEFLKIAEGCDRRCTYCIIPRIRGGYRSFAMDELTAEAKELAEAGVSELILVAQECTRYGVDIYGKKSLPELIGKLCEIEGLRWIRLLYCYPEEIDDGLIDAIASNDKICNYIDMPVQSGSDEILRRMGRRVSADDIRSLVGKLRSRIPDIAIRTTMITGFPGETKEDFEKTLALVRELEFDRLGAFVYSREEGTPAASWPGQVPERVKKARFNKIMSVQREIAHKKSGTFINREMEAVIEGRVVDDGLKGGLSGEVYAARTWRDAPEVDGLLFIENVPPGRELVTGEFVRVMINGASGYDLTGVLCDEDESA